MTEILLKGRKTLTHPPIFLNYLESFKTSLKLKLYKGLLLKIEHLEVLNIILISII